MTGHICPADHPHACDNAFRRCGMLKEGGFKRLDRPVTIARRRWLDAAALGAHGIQGAQ